MRVFKSTKPRFAFRLARARWTAGAAWTSARPSARPLPIGIARRASLSARTAIVRRAAPILSLAIWDAIHGPCRLHLLAGANRVSFLQKLRKSRTRCRCNGVLEFLGQVREGHVRVDGLNIAQQLVREPSRSLLQRRDGIEHSRKDDRLHHIVGGSLHGS